MLGEAKDLPLLGGLSPGTAWLLSQTVTELLHFPCQLQTGRCHQLRREKTSAKHHTAPSWLSLQNSRGICCIIQRDRRAQSAAEPRTSSREAQDRLAEARPGSQRQHTARIVGPLLPAGISLHRPAAPPEQLLARLPGHPARCSHGSCSSGELPSRDSRIRRESLREGAPWAASVPVRTGKAPSAERGAEGEARTRKTSQSQRCRQTGVYLFFFLIQLDC